MSDKQQSAVDWLIENYLPLKRGLELKEPNVLKLINQANELFKQQIIDATMEFMNTDGIPNEKELAEQHFNDKFKTESNGTT